MIENTRLSTLNYLLLGLLSRRPGTGYQLCRTIEQTPMALLSDSPGAIYPALKKLARLHLIEKTEQESGRKGIHPFVATAAGVRALEGWIVGPMDPSAMVKNPSLMLLRLSFIDLVDVGQRQRVMEQYVTGLTQTVSNLSAFLEGTNGALADGGAMAFDLALTMLKAQLKWAQQKTKKPAELDGC